MGAVQDHDRRELRGLEGDQMIHMTDQQQAQQRHAETIGDALAVFIVICAALTIWWVL